jgi:alpha-beta hydrolase superfamily lysophospholipase
MPGQQRYARRPMRHSILDLRGRDGAPFFAQAWLPDREPRAAVQIAHGMAEHSARYERLATFLVDRGYAVYANDHRGHGKSVASDADLGWAGTDGWNAIVSDVVVLAEHIEKTHPGKERCLFGHSMGSFATLDVMRRHADRHHAYVLSGSDEPGGFLVSAGHRLARVERLRQGPRGKSGVLAKMSFGAFNDAFQPARTEFDWLSRDPVEVDRYIADPHCGFRVTNQFWVDFTAGLVAIGGDDWSRMPKTKPIYVFAGERDPVGKMGKGVRALIARLRRSGCDRIEEKLYAEGRHEMLNETNREEVMNEVASFLDRALR